ncbi:MAG: EAL domain-containing protein [Raoultibacter sp.]|jgi:diguanylate cyclase (GGDEF)-like protein
MIIRSIALSFHQLELQNYANKLRYSDSLTGCLNFEGFRNVAEELIRERPNNTYTLWYSDVRRFKFINDMFGYKTGDEFLCYWAQSLANSLKDGDSFCRVSADNFCALIAIEDGVDLTLEFEKMSDQLKAYEGLKDKHFIPELVTGVYELEEADMAAPDINAIMNKANIAQKSVKSLSGSRMAVYDESMKQKQLRELEISQHLEAGLANGEFYIVVQPQYKYTTKEIVGAEALVRWRHSELGNVSPGEFIPLLEKAGLVTELDKFVWEEACKLIRHMLDSGLRENFVPISVNLSRIDLYVPHLADYIFDLVAKYDLTPEHLKLEITESAYTSDSKQLIEVVKDLQQRGFTVEMDDFGSGYSSLNILKDVPVDVLKLDMRFLVVDDKNSKRGSSILSSVIRMAHWINLPVIAEGVETKEQAEYLESLGCYMMQGYYFARPMMVNEFEELMGRAEAGTLFFGERQSDNLSAAEFLATNGSTSYLFNNCIGGGCLFEYDGHNLEALLINDAFYSSIGMSRTELDNYRTHMLDIFIEEDKASLLDSFEEAIKKNSSTVYARVLQGADKSIRWLRGTNHFLASREGKHMMFALIEDVTEQRRSEMRLYEIESELTALTDDSVHRWRAVQHHVMVGLHKAILFDYDVEKDSMAFCLSDHGGHLDEKTVDHYVEEKRFSKVHDDDKDKFYSLILRALERPVTSSAEFRGSFFGPESSWVRADYVGLADVTGQVYRIIGRIEDIESEKQLARQATKDALTGLYNQTTTKSLVNTSLDKKQQGAMILVDVDDFKQINDALGHLFGDSFLREVAKKIGKLFREDDVIGRVGGDEFVIFVSQDLDRTTVEKKAQSILEVFSGIEIPQIGAVHASIGIALAEKILFQDYAALFKKANRALYKAKQKGKNQYVVFDTETDAAQDLLPAYGTRARVIENAELNVEASTWPQTLASDVFSILYTSEDPYDGINKALSHVGNWLDVSRVYVFEKRGEYLFNTFEWCNVGILSEIDNLQNIPDGDENGEYLYIENFDIDDIFYLRYAEDAPAWQREILEPQNIKSMLQYGIIEKNNLVGFVGFDECNENVFWTRDQIEVLVRVAQVIAVFLKQLRLDETS